MSYYQKFFEVNYTIVICIINLEDMNLQLGSIRFRQNLKNHFINSTVQMYKQIIEPLPSLDQSLA